MSVSKLTVLMFIIEFIRDFLIDSKFAQVVITIYPEKSKLIPILYNAEFNRSPQPPLKRGALKENKLYY
ncbi:hypothetical protein PCC7424_3543 [Gloeothece citriformis PCC 7424]|uniref:Uncharacterized protein n=1 Tax=Gloeothece citriformis (strain PCC 7424) TaxID=65393 RepID=B7KGK6_GLOC7|nr:hypothetical protein PCC7424_3543 [Gloeothece citriformis PCC 7424]